MRWGWGWGSDHASIFMNPDLNALQPYPFQRLSRLLQGTEPPADRAHIALSIGEPKHDAPGFVAPIMQKALGGVAIYPSTRGSDDLREVIGNWLTWRFHLKGVDAGSQVLPVNGTREALFAFAQAAVSRADDALVLSPNPFYQIYEGAALLAGAQPYFLNCTAENDFIPDWDAVPASVWDKCQLIYVCSPGNPSGATLTLDDFKKLIALADKHDFLIASDECYSELYPVEGQAPIGLLEACAQLDRDDFARCVVFHSLSKRSNLPGLRSGFVAGDADVLKAFLSYRTYHGCAMPPHHQAVSIAAWQDEAHVALNRELYRKKFDAVLDILGPVLDVARPDAGFYLWPSVAKTALPSDTEFARALFDAENVTVLPGSYLSRSTGMADSSDSDSDQNPVFNPGAGRIRMALVAPLEQCIEAAQRVRRFVESL